jgi:hypothetical protein
LDCFGEDKHPEGLLLKVCQSGQGAFG